MSPDQIPQKEGEPASEKIAQVETALSAAMQTTTRWSYDDFRWALDVLADAKGRAVAQEAEGRRYHDAIRWALGEMGDFKPRAISPRTGKFIAGPYHWRDELRRRAGLEWLHKIESGAALSGSSETP